MLLSTVCILHRRCHKCAVQLDEMVDTSSVRGRAGYLGKREVRYGKCVIMGVGNNSIRL